MIQLHRLSLLKPFNGFGGTNKTLGVPALSLQKEGTLVINFLACEK